MISEDRDVYEHIIITQRTDFVSGFMEPATVVETSVANVLLQEGSEIAKVNQYTFLSKLGEGAYGVVIECEDDKHEKFALKYVSKSLLRRKKEYVKVGRKMHATTAFDDVKMEIALMKKLSHPKIVKLFEVVDDPENDYLFLVLELVRGGQVMDWDNSIKRFKANPRLLKPKWKKKYIWMYVI